MSKSLGRNAGSWPRARGDPPPGARATEVAARILIPRGLHRREPCVPSWIGRKSNRARVESLRSAMRSCEGRRECAGTRAALVASRGTVRLCGRTCALSLQGPVISPEPDGVSSRLDRDRRLSRDRFGSPMVGFSPGRVEPRGGDSFDFRPERVQRPPQGRSARVGVPRVLTQDTSSASSRGP